MDIMELGAIGELVGGIAVIGSLLYVGLQVRQSNRMEMAESIRAATRDYITTFHQLDGGLFSRGVLDFEGLATDEKQTLHQGLFSMFTVAQSEYSLIGHGLADPEIFERHAGWLASITRTPGLEPWWRTVKPLFDEAFRTRLDAAAAEQHGDLPAFHERLPWLSGLSTGPTEA